MALWLAYSIPARAQISSCEAQESAWLAANSLLPTQIAYIVEIEVYLSPSGLNLVYAVKVTDDPDIIGECTVGVPGGDQYAPNPPQDSAVGCGSIIHNDNQAVGERVPVVGAPFDLVYFSDRVIGRAQAYTAQLTYFDGSMIQYLGMYLPLPPSGTGTFVWNGLDSSGNPVQGSITAWVGFDAGPGYEFDDTLIFDCVGQLCPQNGTDPPPPVPAFYPNFPVTVGTYRADLLGLGGWSPSILHYYDTNTHLLYFGDGSNRQVTASNYANGTQLIAGNNDGSELYVFNLSGNHLETLNGLTGSVLYTFAYDSNNHLSTITDAYGNATKVLRNKSGVLEGIESPYGQVTRFTLDPNGFLATITNPNSEAYTMTYDGAGGLLNTFEKPLGQVATMTYDSNGLLTLDASSAGNLTALSSVNPSPGDTTVQSTDALNLLTNFAITSPPNTVPSTYSRLTTYPDTTTETYVSTVNTSDSDRSPSNYYWDSYNPDARLGAIANFTNESGVQNWAQSSTQTLSGWTPSGDPNNPNYFVYTGIDTESTINGNLWDSNFTLATGKALITPRIARQASVTTDTFRKRTQLQLATYTPFTLSYDTHGRLAHIFQGAARKTSIAYFPSGPSKGMVSTVTDALGEKNSFTYDKAGRVLTQTLPDSRVIAYTYDSNGNVKSVTPPSTQPHDFTYDPFDLLAVYAPPLLGSTSTNTQYSYDNDRRLTQIQRPDGNSVNFGYDPVKGVLTTITLPTGTNTYSISAGLVNSATSADQVSDAFTYVYNQLAGDAVSVNGSSIGSIALTENSDFNLTSSVVTPATGASSSIAYTYDTDTLLTGAGVEVVTENAKTGQLQRTALTRVTEAYTYSANYGELATYLGQVHASSLTTILQEAYTRDALGRISTKSETEGTAVTSYAYTYDSSGRLTGVTKNGSPYSAYTYDGNSNRISGDVGGASFAATYDPQDQLLTYNTKSYTYTANGDRASVTDSSLPAGSQTTGYTFDELGNLKQVTLPAETVTYLVDGLNRRVARLVNSAIQVQYLYRDQYRIEAVLGPTGAILRRFVWGTKLNVPDYMIAGGVTYKLISDERGSVRFVVNAASGATVEQIEYDEFGRVLSDTRPGFQPFGFAGGLYDATTGLVHFGAREYDASVGRWLSKDPVLFRGGDTNLYGYVLEDPINAMDPMGLASNASPTHAPSLADQELQYLYTLLAEIQAGAQSAVSAVPAFVTTLEATWSSEISKVGGTLLDLEKGLLDPDVWLGVKAIVGIINAPEHKPPNTTAALCQQAGICGPSNNPAPPSSNQAPCTVP